MTLFEVEGVTGRYFGMYVARPARLGLLHLWYDGPHHSLWIGWLNIGWSTQRWCRKCFPETACALRSAPSRKDSA